MKNKAIKCKHCGTEIQGKQKACPNCGKKLGGKVLPIALALLALFIIIGAIGGGNDDSKPVSANTANSSTEKSNSQNLENKAQKLIDEAKSAFEESNYNKMMEKIATLKEKYGDTKVAEGADEFVSELISTITTVSAVDICKQYSDNEIKADKIYKDQLVIVNGMVASIGKDIFDNVFVTLSDGAAYSLSNAHFTFKNENEIDKVADLLEGDNVVFLGKCTGLSMSSPMFSDCYILD